MFRSWWQKIKAHPAGTVLIALLAVVIVLIILSILGYIFNWGWTGLSRKTLWDWLQLLIIPAVLAVGGYGINLTISRSEQEATNQRAQSEREAAEKRAETEREIASDNQREAALQAYLDSMSELLLHENLRNSEPEDEVRKIAGVRTLTALPRLDPKRKGSVLLFLIESNLIDNEKTVIHLDGADLSGVYLIKDYLGEINLHKTNLSKAYLYDLILL